jgi:putative Ca2+/H+ antiporter (TMEM165/GDT1 family)
MSYVSFAPARLAFFMNALASTPVAFSIFLSVFLAELGDKTQLATMMFAVDGEQSPWLVFAAASLALVASCACAVLIGHAGAKYIPLQAVKLASALFFIGIGCHMLLAVIQRA